MFLCSSCFLFFFSSIMILFWKQTKTDMSSKVSLLARLLLLVVWPLSCWQILQSFFFVFLTLIVFISNLCTIEQSWPRNFWSRLSWKENNYTTKFLCKMNCVNLKTSSIVSLSSYTNECFWCFRKESLFLKKKMIKW